MTNEIQFDQAMLLLHERRMEAYSQKAQRERSYIRHCYRFWNPNPGTDPDQVPSVRAYLEWHDHHAQAEINIMTVEIQQIKARIVLKSLLLEQAKKPPIVSPHGGLATQ